MRTPPFSHRVQNVAILVLLLDLAALVTLVILSGTGRMENGRALQSTLLISGYVLFLLCVLSREKVENEHVSALRKKIVYVEAVIVLCTVIVLDIVQLSLPEKGFYGLKEWRMNAFWNGNYILCLAAVYLIILKIGIRRLRKQA